MLPVVSTAAASAAAATRTQAPMLPIVRGSSSSTTGAARASARTAARSTPGRRAIATTPVRGAWGTSWAISSASTGAVRAASEPARSGARSARQPLQLPGVRGNRLDHLGAEAQCVLERVKALQQGQLAVAAGGAVALDEGVAHPRHHAGIQDADGAWTASLAPEPFSISESTRGVM